MKKPEIRAVNGHTVEIYTGDIPYQVGKNLARAGMSGSLAVDIETTGPDRESLLQYNRGRPAIVTLYAKEQRPVILRVDPMERPNWLCGVLWNADVRKIFHYARFDLSFMMHHWQVRAANVACTRMGAKFCGFEAAQQSLKPQIEYFLGVTLPKTEALSDWTKPTLTDQQIAYALDDVLYLEDLLAAQRKMIRDKEIPDYQTFCDFLPTYVWHEIHDDDSVRYFQR